MTHAEIRAAENRAIVERNAAEAERLGVTLVDSAWLVERLTFDPKAFYKFSIGGWNTCTGERFSWAVPNLVGATYALHPNAPAEVRALFNLHHRIE